MKRYEEGAVTVVRDNGMAVGHLGYWECNPPARDLADDGDEVSTPWLWFTLGFIAATMIITSMVGVIFG